MMGDLADVIDDARAAYEEYLEKGGHSPQPDSGFAFESHLVRRQYGPGGDWTESLLTDVRRMAWTFLAGIYQHLEGVAILLRAPEVSVPLVPIVRATSEIGGRLAWLLDPSIKIRDRVARSVLQRVSDLQREKTTAIALGNPEAPIHGEALRDFRRVTIPELFYPSEVENRNGKSVIRGEALPGLQESANFIHRVVGRPTDQYRGVYDFHSDSTHPTTYTIQQSLVAEPTADGRIRHTSPVNIDDWRANLGSNALILFLDSWNIFASYLGNRDGEVFDKLGARTKTITDEVRRRRPPS